MMKPALQPFALLLASLALVLVGCASSAVAQPDIGAPESAEPQRPTTDGEDAGTEGQAEEQGDAAEEAEEAEPADPRAVSVLKQIEAASSEIETLKARLRYTRIQTLTGDRQRRYGDFYYKASTDESPTLFAVFFDRLLIDRENVKTQNWFVFDGNWLLERDHDNKQAVRRELVPTGAEQSDTLTLGDGQMPIPMRLKADEVLKTYHVKRLADEPFGEEQILVRLQLTPKQAKPGGDKAAPLDLWFDKQTMLLFKLVTEEDGDEIEMVFPNLEPNAQIKPVTFDTKLPKADDGWQVQEVPLAG